ncbi:MAG TPA: MarR family transcriptional regulator [Pseudonocardia sp.]
MTNRIDRLEAKGFVERQAGADDRRSIIVRLTPGRGRCSTSSTITCGTKPDCFPRSPSRSTRSSAAYSGRCWPTSATLPSAEPGTPRATTARPTLTSPGPLHRVAGRPVR